MTGPTGLVNFFVLEGSDYVEQLDALLRASGPSGPDADAFTRAARALRGSATMARRGGISALAAAVERLGRALRERVLPWTPTMQESLGAAVTDLRQLVRSALEWTEADEARAQARTAELLAFAPPSMRAATHTPAVAAGTGTMFVVSGATGVAAALTSAGSRPGNPELLKEALGRVRAFRGVAALRDHRAMAAALDSIEKVARGAAAPDHAPTATELGVLTTGARLLRRLAEDVKAAAKSDPASPEAIAFADAVAHHAAAPHGDDRVVPIASLYHEDDGPHLVRRAQAPGTTAAERFTLESAAAAEHLGRLVSERRQRDPAAETAPASAASDPAIAGAAATLVELARSFDHAPLADALEPTLAGAGGQDGPASRIALSAADAVTSLFTGRGRSVADLTRKVSALAAGRVLGEVVAVGFAQLPTADKATPLANEPVGSVAADVVATPPAVEPVPAGGSTQELEPAPQTEPEPAATPLPTPLPTHVHTTPVMVEAVVAAEADAADAAADVGTTAPPTGRQLHALLATSIEGIERMQTPTGSDQPAPIQAAATSGPPQATHGGATEPIPIDSLLYRGRAALGRALELRDEMKQQGGVPPADKLDELFDLLELAASA